jgi:glycerol-3-phosphate acyltransferase PlsY
LHILILSQLSDSTAAIALGGTATVIGHVWPATTGFRGGKGAATAFGIFVALSPAAAGIVLLVCLLILVLTRYVSLMTMMGVLAGCAYVAVMSLTENYSRDPYFKELGTPFWILSLVLFGVIEFKHLPNFRRLLSGDEPKFGKGGEKRSV